MRREIPRSPRTIRKMQLQAENRKLSGWDRVLKSGPLLISLAGLITSITTLVLSFALNGPQILKNAREFIEWERTDQTFSGIWTNDREGDISPPEWDVGEDVAVALNILVYKDQISGDVVSDRFCRYDTYNTLTLEGRVDGDDGAAILYDYVNGNKTAFAKIQLHLDRKRGTIDVSTTEQAPALLEKAFRLGKWIDSGSQAAPEAAGRASEALKLPDEPIPRRICLETIQRALKGKPPVPGPSR
jgi:hypothetical protein